MRLENKTALITGAAGGIGLAAVKRFLQEGANVMMADMDEERLAAVAKELATDKVAYMAVDVSDEQQVKSLASSTVETFGGINVFVANAGIEGKMGEIIDSDVDNLMKVLDVNVKGVWLGLRYVIPAMKDAGGGSIVITSSGAGVKGAAGMVPYNTSKHAVIGMMRCAALECTKYNIRVNTVNPGPIETRMMDSIAEGLVPGSANDFRNQLEAITPMGRYGKVDEVANLMLFLASDESSYCTGSVYMVDGGNAT
ncbi:SDR family NAD(P)-dependent oxidoreductase [Halioxenophilus aromaticivorans]|uniref:SDR family oxidoreductase n=1 Tax=Halioxenophilus aromaticivorans TaxID=1306992 RepID=A0AAV3U7T9_9ALTE